MSPDIANAGNAATSAADAGGRPLGWAIAGLPEQESYVAELTVGRHRLIADEPSRPGNPSAGPTPLGLLLASLASRVGEGDPDTEVLGVALRFGPWAGRYTYHCHILEHSDRGMMLPSWSPPGADAAVGFVMVGAQGHNHRD